MTSEIASQCINKEVSQDDYILTWMEAFLMDRKAQNMSPGTLYLYQKKLRLFSLYCDTQAITNILQITPNNIRGFILWLEETGHNPGGVNACYRAVKTFLRWWEDETEPDNWKNPIKKVKPPKVDIEPLEPISTETVNALLSTCPRGALLGERDRAAILFLFDTGARAAEFCSINLDDYNQMTGEVIIRKGKGRKPRTAFLGRIARRAIRAYLKFKPEGTPALWVVESGERLTYWGLDEMIERRAKMARVEKPELHAFRRAFALNMLRAGVDLHSLQKLMGHADLQVLKRYLKQNNDDLRIAHQKGSPVDNLITS